MQHLERNEFMALKGKWLAGVTFLLIYTAGLNASDFQLFHRAIQVHGFGSQGFAFSNQNNYLTMQTSKGSFAMTGFGINASTQITDKFRVGAQLFDQNLGKLGNWKPEVDWAMADYRFAGWFGVRGGKVKSVLGLYNDTEDMEFLHTWALMPQSMYPMDVRGDTIAHVGGDIYGKIPIKKLGSFSYTVWGGKRMNDSEGGYLYGLSTSSRVTNPDGSFRYVTSSTKNITSYDGPVFGTDLRWNTPLKGLLAGFSYMNQDITAKGVYIKPTTIPYQLATLKNPLYAFYTEYTFNNLKLACEYRREVKISVFNAPTGSLIPGNENARSGYISAAYRFSKWLEIGAYHSRYIANWSTNHDDPMNHIYDQVVTARLDFPKSLDFKVEGHFIDGAMINSALDRGFYAAPNPSGLKPKMNMLAMRLGYQF
jgi:hypothetical protein